MVVVALALGSVASQAGPSSASGDVAIVKNAQELKEALDAGVRHTHIVEHLDLTTLPAAKKDACGGSCAPRNPSGGSSQPQTQLFPGLFLGPEVQTVTVCTAWLIAQLPTSTVTLIGACAPTKAAPPDTFTARAGDVCHGDLASSCFEALRCSIQTCATEWRALCLRVVVCRRRAPHNLHTSANKCWCALLLHPAYTVERPRVRRPLRVCPPRLIW